MAFHPALNGLQTRLEFRGDGKPFIALTGMSPVNEHFIDVIVEAQWPSGRLAMNYTLLVSPAGATSQGPGNTQSAANVLAPVVSPLALAAVTNPASVAENTRPLETVRVRAGDTASGLVVRPMPEGVTLDQMLLAMVRANPEAFMEGNVNLLREGAQVQLPNAQEATQISAEEARQTVVAQTVDFVAYARRLAQSALQAPDTASREMKGKLSADATSAAAQLPAKDTLTLSQREATSASEEARLAVEREIQDKTEQLAALQKNLETLRSLAASTSPSADKATAAESAASKPLSPSLPAVMAQVQTTSVLESIRSSPSIGAWALALLGSMWAWVWWIRRRPSKGEDLFAQHHHSAVSREPMASGMQEPRTDLRVERAPLPSGLPPQFADLDLNLTPVPETRPLADAAPPAGPKT